MDKAQLQILQHSLGLDQHSRGQAYRNHFVTGEGSADHPHCMALVDQGLMTRSEGNALSGGDDVFCVTADGRAAVREHSPPPPKLTRSQKRYRAYLHSESNWSFGEWLRNGYG